MGDSYGSHVLAPLQRFIETHNNYIAEHDEKLKMLEHRLTALESAQQAPAPAVTVEDCVQAMEEAYGLLANYGDLDFVRFAVVRDTLHTAIKRAKG